MVACVAGGRRLVRKLIPGVLLGALLLGLAIAGHSFMSGKTVNVDWSDHLPFALGFALDRLSGFFLLLICAVAIPVVLFSTSYAGHYSSAKWRWYWCPLFILSMVSVVLAFPGFAFLLGWELMTVLSPGPILVGSDAHDRRRRPVTHLS